MQKQPKNNIGIIEGHSFLCRKTILMQIDSFLKALTSA
jgi:hypothetical protein